MKTGRPTDYSQEIASVICDEIAKGMGLRDICSKAGMPAQSTVCLWLSKHTEFSDQYMQARAIQGDLMDQLINEAADAEPRMVVLRMGSDPQVDPGEVQHRKLKIDALKWRAAHLRPKVYGVKQQVEHTGTMSLEQILHQASQPPEPKRE